MRNFVCCGQSGLRPPYGQRLLYQNKEQTNKGDYNQTRRQHKYVSQSFWWTLIIGRIISQNRLFVNPNFLQLQGKRI